MTVELRRSRSTRRHAYSTAEIARLIVTFNPKATIAPFAHIRLDFS